MFMTFAITNPEKAKKWRKSDWKLGEGTSQEEDGLQLTPDALDDKIKLQT